MKKAIFILNFLFCFSFLFSNTNQSLIIAVLDISSKTKIEKIDKQYLVERIQIELIKYDGIKVVERIQLKKILDEQKMQLTGIMTEKDAIKIGSISGARKIIIGSLTEVDETYMLFIKVIDTETAEIDFIDKISGKDTLDLDNKIPDTINKIVSKLLNSKQKILQIEQKNNLTQENKKKEDYVSLKSEDNKKIWFPIAFSFVTPIQLPGEDYTVYGGAFSLIYGKYRKVYGVFFGYILLTADSIYGFQGGYSFLNECNTLYGLQTGLVNLSHQYTGGAQIGLINVSEKIYGVQVGLVNVAYKMVGVQIGLVNIIKTGFIPVMLGINISF